MGLRGKITRLQRLMRGTMCHIELADGGRFWFSPEDTYRELFRFLSASLRAVHHGTPRPDPPEVLKAVAGARDRAKALEAVYPEGITPWIPVDVEALIERGEFVPRRLTAPRPTPPPRGGPETDGS